jgi:hypothetical protein
VYLGFTEELTQLRGLAPFSALMKRDQANQQKINERKSRIEHSLVH